MIFSYDNSREVELLLRVVNNSFSMELITYLLKQREATVTDIYINLRWEQSVASQHLAKLRNVGLVHHSRDGKNVYYSLDRSKFEELNLLLTKIVEL